MCLHELELYFGWKIHHIPEISEKNEQYVLFSHLLVLTNISIAKLYWIRLVVHA